MFLIQKFGGSSLSGRERLLRSAEIIKAAREVGHRVAAVVSAA